ncbi:vitamin K epoxide reductase family protein [Chitinophaga qingshengii]|uniref:Thioredoxin domain-containing protein n=1 Tax=Chitinophaga qingshengii TaxID=1569794 RepID=A0ABR7TM36_9BACT|nr:vitamin K epoxide reductase family protein [Chitinophaga qingshengii]MBC9930129.1 thioredoxin domain-containing protein [Chitinophaga qingshengii]
MFWNLSEPRPNGPLAASLFLELTAVKLSYTTLQQEVEDHPDYPSLLSISDVFSKYKVDNITANFAPADLEKIPPPYITQIKGLENDTEYFTVVRKFNNDMVSAFDPERRKWKNYRFQDFADRTSGVVLLAEPGHDAGEPDYKEKRREERFNSFSFYALLSVLATIFATVILRAFWLAGLSILPAATFSLLSVIGILVGILLIWYEIDRYNPVIRQICKGGRRVNCNAVLQSDAAYIGGVSWSTIGLAYFTGQLIFMLTQGITSPEIQAITSIVSLLTLPYVFYSLYFQSRIVKQWCLLCLIIQAVLILQASIAAYQTGKLTVHFSPEALVLYILFSVTSLLAILQLLPVLKRAKRNNFVKTQLKRLKYDPVVFNAVLRKQRNIHEDAEGLGIVLGNPNAANKILKVCNPYCGPCAHAHTTIEKLLENNPDIQLQIIFTATSDDKDRRKWPVRHLLAIAADNNESMTKQALGDWYLAPEKDYDSFASRYPMEDKLARQDNKIEAMQNWCTKMEIAHTPTIFINNHELPDIYDIHDLKNFLSV